ncbi:MAG: hypothetical protein Q9227_006889 [Pyrenula ochraceoflavens]
MECGTHFSAAWSFNPVIRQKYCGGANYDFEGWTITDFALDVIIIAMPIPSIWFLKTSVRRKLAITGVFLLAFVGLGASIAKMVVIVQVIQAIKTGTRVPANANIESQLTFWTVLSAGMCVIAANLPSLWLLFSSGRVPEKVLHSIRSLVSLRSNNSGGSNRSNRSNPFKNGNANGVKRDGSSSTKVSMDRNRLVDKVNPEAGGYEAYALRDVDSDLESGGGGGKGMGRGGNGVPPMPPVGNILVKDTVEQSTKRRDYH